MDDPNMHAYGEPGPTDAEIGRQWREDSNAKVLELARLRQCKGPPC